MSFASLCLFCFISTLQSPSFTGQNKKQKKKTKKKRKTIIILFATSNLIFDIALECSYINVNITAWLVNVGQQLNFE